MADQDPFVRWNDEHQLYYRVQYSQEQQQWVFSDWLPKNWAPPPGNRRDSTQTSPTQGPSQPVPQQYQQLAQQQHSHSAQLQYAQAVQQQYAQGAQQQYAQSSQQSYSQSVQRQKGRGRKIAGSYDLRSPPSGTNVHYEFLDQSFFVHEGKFFKPGRVISVLFTEPAGANAVAALQTVNRVTDYNSAFSLVRYQELVHSQIRRFIIVKSGKAHCYAVPIFTYSGQATRKPGVAAQEHAIAYSIGHPFGLLEGEEQLLKSPIPIQMNEGVNPLTPDSRIYFGIHHPIQYNVKVKDLGAVDPRWVPTFLGYWKMENSRETNQDPDVENGD